MSARTSARSHTPRPTSQALRLWRLVRAWVHVLEGLATVLVVFPFVKPRRRESLTRAWSRRLLRKLGVRLHVRGPKLPHPHAHGLMMVANHISWLDIAVLNAFQPSRFVAKAELRRWPVLGWLIAGVGTLFIERARRRHTHAVNHSVADALRHGEIVTVFPEGRTHDGPGPLTFHASLLQPAVAAGGVVVPVALRYAAGGTRTSAPAFVGDTGLVTSFWRMAALPHMEAEVHVLPALDAEGRHRRDLAQRARAAIAAALAAADAGSAPGTPGRRRAAAR